MKETTVHSLTTARALLEHARALCNADDRYQATAGLIVLQDAVEVVLLTLLIELGEDETKSLENHTFDQLVGDLRGAGHPVPKSGTLKAMNKHRVTAKHYAQLAEPTTVRQFLSAAEMVIDSITKSIVGKSLAEIFLTDLLEEGEARDFLSTAYRRIEDQEFVPALINIRKAIFVEIEWEYSIYDWRDKKGGLGIGLIDFGRGGHKAPYFTRNEEWISENVHQPTDYVQHDHERLRLDAVEWGVNTSELHSLLRLTPAVFRVSQDSPWRVSLSQAVGEVGEATPSNTLYCLDKAISIISRKQAHKRAARYPGTMPPRAVPKKLMGAPIYKEARTGSQVIGTLQKDWDYQVREIVDGFETADERFLRVHGSLVTLSSPRDPAEWWISGYVHFPKTTVIPDTVNSADTNEALGRGKADETLP